MPLPAGKLALAVTRLRCPVCLEGEVFRGLFETLPRCPRCGYFYSRESGYFLGSVYVGYGSTVVVAIAAGLLFGYALGLGWTLPLLAILLAVAAVFPIWFFRYSRMLWMALDIYLNPPVREDFQRRGR